MSKLVERFMLTKFQEHYIIILTLKSLVFYSKKIPKNIDKIPKISYNISKECKESKESKKRGDVMELARVTTKGQITIPKSIREILNVKEGSQIIFLQRGNDIIIKNSAMIALEEIQDSFNGEAQRLGLKNDEDVVKMIKEYRKSRK